MAKFKSERQKVYKSDYLGTDQDIDGTPLVDMIAKLTALKKAHGDNAKIDVEVDTDSGGYYTSINFRVSSTRLETDLEYAERHKERQAAEKAKRDQAKKRRLEREERERKEYERLQKKYGK